MPVLLRKSDRSRALRVHAAGRPAPAVRVTVAAFAACALHVCATPARANDAAPVEEMIVVGDDRAPMDVLAGASTTRLDVGEGLLDGARLDDLLAEVPGVQVRRLGGAGGSVELSIRGSSPQQVPIFLDGVRIESGLTARGDLSSICLDVLDEIQVTRGAGAARAGSGGIGGIVNLVSRSAATEPETRLRIGGGNFGTAEGSVRHARPVGDWTASLAYCGLRTDGDFKFQRARDETGGGSSPVERRRNNRTERHTALVQLERPFESARMKLTQLLGHLERGAPGPENNQRDLTDEENLSLLSIASLKSSLDPDASFEWSATLAHRFENNRFRDLGVFIGQPEPLRNETTLHSITPRIVFRRPLSAFDNEHEISVLAEGRLDYRGSNEANSRSRLGGSARVEATTRWLGDRLRISPSVRVERFEGLNLEWVPALFLEASPHEFITLKASASRSYRAPSFQELYLPNKGFERGNEDLDAEDAWNFEAGTRIESPFSAEWLQGEIEFTYFYSELDQSIVFQQISPNIFSYQNVGPSRTRGHELTLIWRPHPWVRGIFNRTVTQTRRDSTNRNVAGVAVSQIDGRVELGPRDFMRLVGEVHYVGRIPLNDAGTRYLVSRVSFDASAALELTQIDALPQVLKRPESLWVTLRGRNLSNVSIRDTRGFPHPGRNFSLTVEGSF